MKTQQIIRAIAAIVYINIFNTLNTDLQMLMIILQKIWYKINQNSLNTMSDEHCKYSPN